ncbi:MAG TPA: hypothetical protein VGK67_37635 [Myxococcales bacterium]
MAVEVVAAALLSMALSAEPVDAGALAADPDAAAAAQADAGAADAPVAAPPKAKRVFKGERRAPVGLLNYLRKQTLGDWCAQGNWGAPAPMEASRFLELRGGSLLFFVQVPNYLCSSTNSAVPVVVTSKGEWKWGAPIDGLVTHLARSEDGTLWASTQWQIEGTYPALYRSKDGIAWKEVELPKERATTGPMEEMTTLCFGYQTVVVKIANSDDSAAPAVEVWSRERKGEQAAWAKEPKGVDGGCLPPQPTAEHWTRDAGDDDRVLFLKDAGKQVFSLPKLLRPR